MYQALNDYVHCPRLCEIPDVVSVTLECIQRQDVCLVEMYTGGPKNSVTKSPGLSNLGHTDLTSYEDDPATRLLCNVIDGD